MAMSRKEALEAHIALFGIFDDETAAAIEAAIDQQEIPEMSEKKMSAKERRDLPDSAFGLPKQRKYPMTDADRVKNAIKYFKFCPASDRDELAENIKKAVKKFKIKVVVTKGNPIVKYFPDAEVVPMVRKTSAQKEKE